MTSAIDAVKALLLVFFAGLLQVSIVAPIEVAGGSPDVLLVTLVAVALLRGPIHGALCGFFAGLIVDTATLETLGLTSLVLTVAGYWIGRYGETTGRDRSHAPLLSVVVITLLYSLGVLALHFMIGDAVSAGARPDRDDAAGDRLQRPADDPDLRALPPSAPPAPARPRAGGELLG